MTVICYAPTWEGFLTGVFSAFSRKNEDVRLRRAGGETNTSLFGETLVAPDMQKAARVWRGMERLGREVPETLYQAWLSEIEGVEDDILACLQEGFAQNSDPLADPKRPLAARLRWIAGRVGWEAQRMRQFVRFVETPEGVFVADIEPEYNVITLIGEHFHGRFNDQRLIIRDVRRRVALVSDTDGWCVAALPGGPLPPLPRDGAFEAMWKSYFKVIANPARINTKLQQQFIPKKYRRFLTEFMPQ